ncbi:MAG: allophanate hydrolase [Armatimonadetes bacterium]|nr:allophanate hydrolase [Akkermansiaceae bacterium]
MNLLTIRAFKEVYVAGRGLEEAMRKVWEAIRDEPDEGIFISKMSWDGVMAQISVIREDLVLYGIPFVAKDNIDVAGLPTTAACPQYSYEPVESATVIRLLQEAGAVCFGKTNLDQFATGLVGVRTPYPVPKNPFDANYIPGGSSCGSAVAVAKGLVPFSLGTDTAGSGRVPAAYNELIGLKPTRGYISTMGVVDACKSLDCVSVFTNSCEDADLVLRVTAKYDPDEAWSRKPPGKWNRLPGKFRFGVPKASELRFFGWDAAGALYEGAAVEFEALGGARIEVDVEPFLGAAKLLYEGPWVTERFIGIKEFLKAKPEAVLEVTREIIEKGELPLAGDLFAAQYRLAEYKRLATQEMEKVDFMLLPTTPRNFTLAEVAAEPIRLNSILGTYTNFMNLLDYAAVALPAGRYEGKLPWGVTIFAEAGMDRALLELGAKYEEKIGRGKSTPCAEGFDEVQVVVCGAHLEGMALNWQLAERGGSLVAKTTTADCYRLYLVPASGALPERPALVRVGDGDGLEIECEVWRLKTEGFGDFVSKIPGPLGMGKVLMENGVELCGFIAEPRAVVGARDLSEFGGWRGYLLDKR